jgi:hypothetical protein
VSARKPYDARTLRAVAKMVRLRWVMWDAARFDVEAGKLDPRSMLDVIVSDAQWLEKLIDQMARDARRASRKAAR